MIDLLSALKVGDKILYSVFRFFKVFVIFLKILFIYF